MSQLLEALILPYASQIGIQIGKNPVYKNCGVTYAFLPEAGEGFYWAYGYENDYTIAICDMHITKTVSPGFTHPAYFTIGWYNHAMGEYFYDLDDSINQQLLSYSAPQAYYESEIYQGFRGKTISISLSEPYARKMAELLGLSLEELRQRCFSMDGNEDIPEVTSILKQIKHYTPSEQYAPLYYQSKITEVLTILCQRHELMHPVFPTNHLLEDDKQNLMRVADYLHTHYAEAPDLNTLKSIAYMGRTKLVQSFKQLYGVTITDYTQNLRIDHAKLLLKKKQLSLGEIAAALGYKSQGSFTGFFKKLTGMTPREYRSLFTDEIIS